MARNLTTVLEHENVTIIPYLGIEIRGRGVMALLFIIYVPVFAITYFFLKSVINIFLLVFLIEIITLFFAIEYLQKDVRRKTDHISAGKKFIYEYKAYRKINLEDGQVFYLRPTSEYYLLDIRRLK